MSSLLIFSVSFIVGVYGQNGCAYFGEYSTFNGQFYDSGLQNNGKNYYVMDNSAQTNCNDPIYIFYNLVFNKWYLYTQLLSADSITYYYVCDTITDINDVFSCTNWKYSDDSDVGVFFTSGDCPEAICAEITLDVPAGACSTTMNYLQTNQFSSAGNAPYLIYNEKFAKWLCVADITENWGCQPISASFIQTDPGFITPFKNGDVVTYVGNPGNVAVQFTCTGAVSLAPTMVPSNQPSKNPTVSPTNFPSQTPTGQPSTAPVTSSPSQSPLTSQPSGSPTNVPSKAPSPLPTRSPLAQNQTHNPTKSPTLTEFPTKSPTNFPTKAPTYLPTLSPLDPNQTQSQPPTKSPTTLPAGIVDESTTKVKVTDSSGSFNDEEGLFGVSFLKIEYVIILVVVLFCLFFGLCVCCYIRYKSNREYDAADTTNPTNEMIQPKNTNHDQEQQNVVRKDDGGFEYYQ